MIYAFRDCELDSAVCEIRRNGVRTPAQPKVIALLLHLARNRDRVVPKTELLDALWPDVVVSESSLMRAVSGARRALGDDGTRQELIESVRGVGYRLTPPIEERHPERRPSGTTDLVGRERELARLAVLLDETVAGGPRMVVVSGPPGVGKTALVQAFAARASRLAVECLMTSAGPGSGGHPRNLWARVMEQFAEGRSPAALRAFFGEAVADLGVEVPALAAITGRPATTGSNGRRRGVRRAVERFLARAAASHPLLIVLDDLHQADRASLEVLASFADPLRRARVMLIAVFGSSARSDPGRGRLERGEGVQLLDLEPLSRGALATLAQHFRGTPLDERDLDALWTGSAGNPLLATRALASGVLSVESRRSLARPLRAAVERCLADLRDTARSALEAAAALGASFSASALAHALDRSPMNVVRDLDAAVLVGAIEELETDRFRFRQELVRQVLYSRLPIARRTLLHARIAKRLETTLRWEDADGVDGLVHHAERAVPALAPERAAAICQQAAAHAAERSEDERARRFLRRAMRIAEAAQSTTIDLDTLRLTLARASRRRPGTASPIRIVRDPA